MSPGAKVEKLKNIRHENLRMRRGPIVIGDILYNPGGACGPRIQHDYQLVIVHTGCLDLLLDGQTIHVGQGQGILLSPGHREHFIFSGERETHHSWFAIHPKAVPPALKREFHTFRGPIPFAGRMHTLLELSRRPLFGSLPEAPLEAGFYLGLGLALMCDFASAVRSGKKMDTAAEAVLAKMEQFIWKEFASHVSLHDIARAVGVSRQHLLKLCRMHNKHNSDGRSSTLRGLKLLLISSARQGFRSARSQRNAGLSASFTSHANSNRLTGRAPPPGDADYGTQQALEAEPLPEILAMSDSSFLLCNSFVLSNSCCALCFCPKVK